MPSLYSHAELYEAAFSYRDIAREVDVLEAWFEQHARRRLRSVCELGAGPAQHARELARRGMKASAVDLSGAMCALARRRAREEGLTLSVHRDDMRTFKLPEKFDFILNMLDSSSHLLSVDDMIRHLERVAAHLEVGGLYLMECAYPATRDGASSTRSEWTSRRGELEVAVSWTVERFDPVSQMSTELVTVTARDGRAVHDRLKLHPWSPFGLEACVRNVQRLSRVARFGAFGPRARFGQPPASWRMIDLYRRGRG